MSIAVILAVVVAALIGITLLVVYFTAERRAVVTQAAGDEPNPRPDEWSHQSIEAAEDQTAENLTGDEQSHQR